MRVGTPGFNPERLKTARAARRIVSKSELARRMGLNASTVGRWEAELSSPDADALTQLSQELKVRREYFLRPNPQNQKPMFHRSLSSTLKRDIQFQKAQMSWMHDISETVQHYVNFSPVDIPDVLAGAQYTQLRDEDIECIAIDLRNHWNLGDGPCTDVVALLERVGCVVGTIEMGTSKLDGLCSWSEIDNRPHILLANDKMSFPRRQMDAAHELAHAVLHRGISTDELKTNLKFIESQAFRLASAFLLPSTTYPLEVRNLSLATLRNLKERWRVAIKAQIKRLADLEILTREQAQQLYKLHSAKGWNRREPLDNEWPIPEPRAIADALNLIVDSNLRTKSDLLAVEFTLSAGDIENLANLPPGWFSRVSGEIVHLKQSKVQGDQSPEESGIVVPFQPHK